MSTDRFAYVGITACGCMVCASVEDPRWKRETAKDVAAWLRDGLRVERVPVERVRQECHACPHKATVA
jgi:hypothetical protein